MANLYRNFGSSPIKSNYTKKNELIPVRVVDIILDSSHPEYEKWGSSTSIGAIKYVPLDKTFLNSDTRELAIAFPINSSIKTLPLINEIVLIIQAPDNLLSEDKGTSKTTYYTTIVSIWNHPTHNKAPRGVEIGSIKDRYSFPDITNINPLQPFPGDLLIEGRLGQSIRFGGSKFISSSLTTTYNDGEPYMLLSNGQKPTKEGYHHIVEDIDKDASSIYLVSNHTIPVEPSRVKHDTLHTKPKTQESYHGSQVVVNGGRLYFNAKDDDIAFTSTGIFSISSESIGIDGHTEIGIDAKKVYLGSDATKEKEPVIRGDQLEILLFDLLEIVRGIGVAMSNATAVSGGPVTGLITESQTVLRGVANLKSLINPGGPSFIKSKKVFTE